MSMSDYVGGNAHSMLSIKRTRRAMTTPTSRSVSMIFRDYNPNPVIDARPRW